MTEEVNLKEIVAAHKEAPKKRGRKKGAINATTKKFAKTLRVEVGDGPEADRTNDAPTMLGQDYSHVPLIDLDSFGVRAPNILPDDGIIVFSYRNVNDGTWEPKRYDIQHVINKMETFVAARGGKLIIDKVAGTWEVIRPIGSGFRPASDSGTFYQSPLTILQQVQRLFNARSARKELEESDWVAEQRNAPKSSVYM